MVSISKSIFFLVCCVIPEKLHRLGEAQTRAVVVVVVVVVIATGKTRYTGTTAIFRVIRMPAKPT